MGLNADSWRRVERHFDALSELPAARRPPALDALGLDEADRALLERLLKAHDEPDPLLSGASAPDLLELSDQDTFSEQIAKDWTGRRLGPWQVGEQIGRGGMSVIHLGHRADGRFEMKVAIKVLDIAQLGPSSHHRLEEEIRILARLEHPGIARLIDSGTAEDGHPYLVMEHVAGCPIDAYADGKTLGLRERVRLVLQVARALEDAHQREVIHCDVKPSNILVSDEGQVRVVDFGIAALIRRHGKAASIDHHYCSPAHAAPERLAGALPTTRQDVFSLGSVLYRLLSGRQLRSATSSPVSAPNDSVTPPSARAGPDLPFAARRLLGDLDAICLKALAKDAAERYGSMAQLIADLQAWLDRRPVLARGGGRLYTLDRWLRRHTAAAVLGLLLVAALTGGALVALDQARQTRKEAERAVAARDFLVGILEAADPTLEYGHDPTASELLRRGASRIHDTLQEQPGLRIELLLTIGRTQLERGLIDDAAETLDQAIAALSSVPAHPDHSAVLAGRGMAAYEQGRYDQAVGFLQRARAAPGAPTLATPAGREIAVQLADMLVVDNQPEAALELIDTVLATRPAGAERAAALRVMGAALEMTDQLEAAERTLREAWSLQQETNARHINLAKIENDLGIVYWRMNDMDRAAAQFDAAWRHKQAIYGRDHPQTLASLGNLAGVHSARRDHPAAERAYRESLDGLMRVHGRSPHPDIAYTHGMLALNAYWREDFDSARARVEAGLAHRRRVAESDHASVAWLDSLAALIAYERGETIEAAALGKDSERCRDWTEATRLGQRLCMAWWSFARTCPTTGMDQPDRDVRADWPARWQRAWQEIAARCELIRD